MLLTKEVEERWNTNNIKHYESLGYKFTKKNDSFVVPIQHLPNKSAKRVNIKCDYCGREFKRSYSDHTFIQEKELFIKKDACIKCRDLKSREGLELRQKLGLLTTKDNGYWTFKENRLKELKSYIDNNGNIDNLYSKRNDIGHNFSKNNHDIFEAVSELGYDYFSISNRIPVGYYDVFENLKSRIELFICQYGKFPTTEELRNTLGIEQQQLQKYGGIFEVKRRMNYNDDNDLQDDNKFYNRSAYEYIVAQYLIHNTDITYLREQYPFPREEGLYRSDFTFIMENNEPIHVEIWGGGRDNYQEIKKKKILLYKKYNINLISIEPNIFTTKMDTIQKKLKNIFAPFVKLKYKYIDSKLFIPTVQLSDEELLDRIMKYSDTKEVLPSSKYLKDIGQYKLFAEVSRRYGSYHEFANKMGKQTIKVNQGYWTKETITDAILKVIKSGKSLCRDDLRELRLNSLEAGISRNGGLIEIRLEFYNKYAEEVSICLSNREIKFLKGIANNRGTNIMNKVTPEQQELAKQILLRMNISPIL